MATCELLVLRHGQAENGNPGGDFARDLTARGTEDAARAGEWLAANERYPDHVFCSSAARARQTVSACLRGAGRASQAVSYEDRIYNASLPALFEVLAEAPELARRVLIVGHNPGLGNLVGTLARDSGPMSDPYYHLRPATLVHLLLDREFTDLAERCGEVLQRVHP